MTQDLVYIELKKFLKKSPVFYMNLFYMSINTSLLFICTKILKFEIDQFFKLYLFIFLLLFIFAFISHIFQEHL